MNCARCGGTESVVETCASSKEPSCKYCREYFIEVLDHERMQQHYWRLSDWLYAEFPDILRRFFKEYPHG